MGRLRESHIPASGAGGYEGLPVKKKITIYNGESNTIYGYTPQMREISSAF